MPIYKADGTNVSDLAHREEYRICSECEAVMFEGYMEEDGDRYFCETCMCNALKRGKFRHSSVDSLTSDGTNPEGGFYDENWMGEWSPTSIFYTEWYDYHEFFPLGDFTLTVCGDLVKTDVWPVESDWRLISPGATIERIHDNGDGTYTYTVTDEHWHGGFSKTRFKFVGTLEECAKRV